MLHLITRWLDQRKAIAELSAMPDYLLADLGLTRDAIPAVVKGMADRRVLPPGAAGKPLAAPSGAASDAQVQAQTSLPRAA